MEEEFNIERLYKKKYSTAIIFGTIMIISLVFAILFEYKWEEEFVKNIFFSITSGCFVSLITQWVIYLNKRPRIKMQEDLALIRHEIYATSSYLTKIIEIQKLDSNKKFEEFMNYLEMTYKFYFKSYKRMGKLFLFFALTLKSPWLKLFTYFQAIKKSKTTNLNDAIIEDVEWMISKIKIDTIPENIEKIIREYLNKLKTFKEEFYLFYTDYKARDLNNIF